jgi:hypothetical protein
MKQKFSIIQSCKLIICSFIINLFIICPTKGQIINLVPDPSFEDTLSVINYWTQWSLKHWKNLDSSRIWTCRSFYTSINNPNPNLRLPINQWCNQNPRSGSGIINLDFYYPTNSFGEKSITRVKLKSKLISGKVYCAKIYAVFAERYSPYITDGLQLYFDNGGLDTMISIHNDSSSYYPHIIPQISQSQGQILSDTVNWNLLMGSFVANGTEEFLTIGNFKHDSNTIKFVINPNTLNDPTASLLIDDVSVYPIDLSNWLPPTYGYSDTALIGLPNYETPDAKWYTYTMQLIDSGSQIKVVPPASGTQYICGIDLCNTMVFDTVTVVQWPLSNSEFIIKNSKLKVWPNPTNSFISIACKENEPIKIIDITGKVIQQFISKAAIQQVDVSAYANGLYFVQQGNRSVKFVKE